MKLIKIPPAKYDDYRRKVIFHGYKWDPQYLDNNTIAKHVLVITEEEHRELVRLTEKLDWETREAEKFLNHNFNLIKPLNIPRPLRKELRKMKNYDPDKHIRLNRYDFHPTVEGNWALSEVNSDVPGGFAEASLMPRIAMGLFPDKSFRFINFSDILIKSITTKVKPGSRIIFVHCTSYSDDRQVMQFIGDKLCLLNYEVIYAAADHLHFINNDANSILAGYEGKVDAIIRFTPLEWLIGIKPKRWPGYFDTKTLSCNHPLAIFAQTKRFPFVWNNLEKQGIFLPTWRELLPETISVKDGKNREGFIYKPVYGRVGEKISIKEACRDDEYEKIIKDIRKNPRTYLAQKRFNSQPLTDENGESFHVCLGSYSVDGAASGYYARINKAPRIDSNAADIPVLIEGKDENNITPITVHKKSLAETTYEVWAPPTSRWSAWVRPVPFLRIGKEEAVICTRHFEVPVICYLTEPKNDTAIILDLPSYEGILEGIAFAYLGFRPVPLYNGTYEPDGAIALLDNHMLSPSLTWGAGKLNDIDLKADAPPVFLLDSNRLSRKRKPEIFDNGWDIYEQDLPSGEYFREMEIKSIIIRASKIQKDLAKILGKMQKKGLNIYLTNGFDEPKKVAKITRRRI